MTFIHFFYIICIVNCIELNFKVKKLHNIFINNDTVLYTIFQSKEEFIVDDHKASTGCIYFNKKETSIESKLDFKANCAKHCQTSQNGFETIAFRQYCPLYGTVTRIVFTHANDFKYFVILVEGCYTYTKENKLDVIWCLSSRGLVKNEDMSENWKEEGKDQAEIFNNYDINCADLCTEYKCSTDPQVNSAITIHLEETEGLFYKNFVKYMSIFGPILCLLTLIIAVTVFLLS